MAKKYLSKINKSGSTLYIKDTEAQAKISEIQSSFMTSNQAEALFDTVFNDNNES